jgi:hypothetical protein
MPCLKYSQRGPCMIGRAGSACRRRQRSEDVLDHNVQVGEFVPCSTCTMADAEGQGAKRLVK